LKPEINEQINGYEFYWPTQHILIKVSRITVHKDGRVTGELVVVDKSNAKILMPATQLNFSAERTRTGLIKSLTEKFSKYSWAAIIDQVAYHVQDLARQGEPARELWTHEDVKEPEYLLEPILFKGLPTVIYGEKGVSKSTLSLAFYICLALPWYDNPLGLVAPDRSVKTLILDWETEADIVQYYAKRFQVGMNLPPFPVMYRRCNLPLVDDLEQIEKHIADTQAEVVIIDSLGAAAGGDLKSPEVALKFFAGLRRLKTSPLLIAQTSKDEETRKKRIFGSVYFEYYSRSIFELCKSESINDNEVDIALFHRSSNLTSLQKPMGFLINFNGAGLSIERKPVDMQEFRARLSNSSRVLEVLKSGKLSVPEIATNANISRDAAQVALTRLKKKDKVIDLERGLWGLYAQPELS